MLQKGLILQVMIYKDRYQNNKTKTIIDIMRDELGKKA